MSGDCSISRHIVHQLQPFVVADLLPNFPSLRSIFERQPEKFRKMLQNAYLDIWKNAAKCVFGRENRR